MYNSRFKLTCMSRLRMGKGRLWCLRMGKGGLWCLRMGKGGLCCLHMGKGGGVMVFTYG